MAEKGKTLPMVSPIEILLPKIIEKKESLFLHEKLSF